MYDEKRKLKMAYMMDKIYQQADKQEDSYCIAGDSKVSLN